MDTTDAVEKENRMDNLKNSLSKIKAATANAKKVAKPVKTVKTTKVAKNGHPSSKKGKYSPEMKDALWKMAKKDGITAEVLATLAKKYPDARGLDRGKANSIVQARKNKIGGKVRGTKKRTMRKVKHAKVNTTVTWVHPGGDKRKPTTFKRWGDGKVLVIVGDLHFNVSEDKAKSILSDLI